MKKVLVSVVTLALIFSLSITAIAAPGNSNKSNGKGPNKEEKALAKEEKALAKEEKALAKKEKDLAKALAKEEKALAKEEKALEKEEKQEKKEIQKKFRDEMNEKKKDVVKQKNEVNKEKGLLEARYEELLASGDLAGAEAILEEIDQLKLKKDALQSEMKQIINERFMIVKTLYSAEELKNFEDASALIEQMYEDANVLGAGSITIKNNIIKFEAPPYLKGRDTMIPVRTIAEEFGAEVAWDEETQTVTITKDNTVVEMTINRTTVFVNGEEVDMGAYAEITCGRTYIPLGFLAKVFNLEVIEDDENEVIIVDEPKEETEEPDEELDEEPEETEEEIDTEEDPSDDEPVDDEVVEDVPVDEE